MPRNYKPNKEQLKAHYDLERELSDRLRYANKAERKQVYGAVYDELYKKVEYLLPMQRAISTIRMRSNLRMLSKFLKPDSIYLEIGPGNCLLAFSVAEKVRMVYAVDVSAEVTANKSVPENFKLFLSNGTSVSVPDKSVDFVFSDQLMEHLHDEDALEQLQNIYKALKTGGKYLCVTPNKFSGPHDVSQYFDDIATGFHLHEYSVSELVNIFKKAGFSKMQLLVGTRGFTVTTIPGVIILLEKIFGVFPAKIRKMIGRTPPFKLLFGIKLLATK